MARKTVPTVFTPKLPLELTVTREEAKSRLEDRIEKGLEIKNIRHSSWDTLAEAKNAFNKWDSFNTELLRRIFTTDEMTKEYDSCGFGMISLGESSLSEEIADHYKLINEKNHRIDSIIERLELIPLCAAHQTDMVSQANQKPQSSERKSKKVFVVHGHDEIAKTNLEVFLREIGLEPVVLHRQPDEGQTIIEKFEKHSDVGYAFILLTPDEIAYLSSDSKKDEKDRALEFRARPNVIFEFGYFVGKLGRSRVCCLYTGNVQLPSDVSGMIYKKFEKSIEEVAYGVIKDLKACGYAIV